MKFATPKTYRVTAAPMSAKTGQPIGRTFSLSVQGYGQEEVHYRACEAVRLRDPRAVIQSIVEEPAAKPAGGKQ